MKRSGLISWPFFFRGSCDFGFGHGGHEEARSARREVWRTEERRKRDVSDVNCKLVTANFPPPCPPCFFVSSVTFPPFSHIHIFTSPHCATLPVLIFYMRFSQFNFCE